MGSFPAAAKPSLAGLALCALCAIVPPMRFTGERRIGTSAGLLLIFSIVAGCDSADEDPAANAGDAQNQSVLNLPSIPRPEPPINRADLLSAVAMAASAKAGGAEVPADVRALDGKRFELRIRFGCRGPAPDLQEAVLGWTFDREERTLRLRATPTISSDDALVEQVAGEEYEAVEGFWVPRPWLLEPVCPAAAAVRGAPAEAPQTEETAADQAKEQRPSEDKQEAQSPPPAFPRVGIAQFYTDTDARTRRRAMRPYESVKIIEEGRPISSQGYNLVLAGRLRALPGKGVIECVATSSDAPPDCIVSANIDQVRIERPEDGELLAEWGSG